MGRNSMMEGKGPTEQQLSHDHNIWKVGKAEQTKGQRVMLCEKEPGPVSRKGRSGYERRG